MDSAEKWKQFAEDVQAQAAELGEQLAGVQAELQASRFVLLILLGTACGAANAAHHSQALPPNWLQIATASLRTTKCASLT